jgi:hypothetical protein
MDVISDEATRLTLRASIDQLESMEIDVPYRSAFADAFEVVKASGSKEEALEILNSLDFCEQERTLPVSDSDDMSDLYD